MDVAQKQKIEGHLKMAWTISAKDMPLLFPALANDAKDLLAEVERLEGILATAVSHAD